MMLSQNVATDARDNATGIASDTVDMKVASGFLLRSSVAIKFDTKDGTTCTFLAGELAVGVVHPIAIRRLWATGSTAAQVALFYGKY